MGSASWEALGSLETNHTVYGCASKSLRRSLEWYQNENGTVTYDFWDDQISFDFECTDEFSNLVALKGGGRGASSGTNGGWLSGRYGIALLLCIPCVLGSYCIKKFRGSNGYSRR